MRGAHAVVAAALVALTPVPVRALDVSVVILGCNPGSACGWWLKVAPDRKASVEFMPERHLSREFTISRKQFKDLQALIERENFFSLPPSIGVLFPDATTVEIEVRDGSKSHKVRLGHLPQDLAPIWKTDPSSLGRGFRVCEGLRKLIPVASAGHCPGVPDAPVPNK